MNRLHRKGLPKGAIAKRRPVGSLLAPRSPHPLFYTKHEYLPTLKEAATDATASCFANACQCS
ncbi:MAG: hypothetical protein AB1861_13625 [Cyanobacteriota bacterium]